jgi:beta-glucosidase
VQLYLSGAQVPGLVTPRHNLVGFKRVGVAAGATTMVAIEISPASLETAMADGTRKIVPGSYKLSAGGHQPDDAEGDTGSSGPCVVAPVQLRARPSHE